MEQVDAFLKRFRRNPADIVGIDVGTSAVKAVRMRKHHGGQPTVLAAGIFPIGSDSTKNGAADSGRSFPLLSQKLRARYASIAVTGLGAIIKLLSLPGKFESGAEDKVVENLGLRNPEQYRIAYKVVREGHGRSESRVVAVALPESEAQRAMAPFASGLPSPFSLEIAGIATLTAFSASPLARANDQATGLVEFGASSTFVSFFYREALLLVRQFEVGANEVIARVQKSLGTDAQTARGIITGGAFDISQPVMEVCGPLIKQLAVSRDFVERREDCRVGRIFISGGMTATPSVLNELRSSLEVEVDTWNPLEGLQVAANAIPPEIVGQEWRLSAAIGTCLATLEAA
jgi:Tfp pilus assembly PilM family ATPase